MKYLTQVFVTYLGLQYVVAPGIEKSAFRHNTTVLSDLVEDKLHRALPVRCDADKEGLNTPLFNMVGDVILQIFQYLKMNLLLIMNIEALPKFDNFWTHYRERWPNASR